MLPRITALAPLFVSVIACAALVVPTGCDVKVNLAGEYVSGAIEVPVRLTTSGLLPLLVVKGTAAEPSIVPAKVG
jgi:hypothetical protein